MQPLKRTIPSTVKTNIRRGNPAESISNVYKNDDAKSWHLRNNSLNVSQLLAPYIYDLADIEGIMARNGTPPKKMVLYSNEKKQKPRPPRQPQCSECYCNEDPVLPRLNPKTFYEHDVDSAISDHANHPDLNAMSSDLLNYHPAPRFLMKYHELPQSRRPCQYADKNINCRIGYTDKRENYEKMVKPEEKRMNKSSPRENLPHQSGDNHKTEPETFEKDPIQPEPSKRKGTVGSLELAGSFSGVARSDVDAINKFRGNHYFECHSSEDPSSRKVPPHKCVHKFTINKRLFPEPVNKDVFGTSRCAVCNQPMKKECELHKRSNSFRASGRSAEKSARKSHKSFSKHYDPELFSKTVNIGCGCEVIEIAVPKELAENSHSFVPMLLPAKLKKHVPRDSMALRFQKGVMK